MSPATFRIRLSDPEFSMVTNTEAAVTDKLNDKPRHFLLGSTDSVLEILSRYKKGELLDAKISQELFNVIGARKRSLDIYTTQKLQKKVFYSDSDYLLSHLEQSHREQLFTVFYTRRKVSLDQKIPVEIRIDRIIRNLREQGDGLKRIFKKKESLLGRRSLHMDVAVSLETFSSTDRGLIRDIPPMPDIAESVNVYKLEIETELSLLRSRKVTLRDSLLQAIESFQADSKDSKGAIAIFQKILRENRDLEVLQAAIDDLEKKLIS